MEKCHGASVELIKSILAPLKHHARGRALEVAAGDGRLTVDFLAEAYRVVDLFDQD